MCKGLGETFYIYTFCSAHLLIYSTNIFSELTMYLSVLGARNRNVKCILMMNF